MNRQSTGPFAGLNTTHVSDADQKMNYCGNMSNHESMNQSANEGAGVYHPHINNASQAPRVQMNDTFGGADMHKASEDGFNVGKQTMWSPDEDTTLVRLVEKIGPQKWALIADYLPNRQGKHCRERWHNHLNPRNKRCEWTKIEEWVLFLLHRKLENQWA